MWVLVGPWLIKFVLQYLGLLLRLALEQNFLFPEGHWSAITGRGEMMEDVKDSLREGAELILEHRRESCVAPSKNG